MIIEAILLMTSLPLIEQTVYLLDSEDGSSVQFYDCIVQNDLPYCRRPTHMVNLVRDRELWACRHNGTMHSFSVLEQHNISVSTILHEWKSSVEMAEEYAFYLRRKRQKIFVNGDEKFLCQCNHAQSFGKYCEYQLGMGTIFGKTLDWQLKMRTAHSWQMQLFGDIVCYRTLECDSGLLCLDWRDICDGVQHCMFGYDEENCDKLEFNECEDNEYRCINGMCIPDQYFLDGDYDCMDMSDEKGQVNDKRCTFQKVTYECDDRMCLRPYWPCGDGQCIRERTEFQRGSGSHVGCTSLREQYHMCETHGGRKQWTLSNGRCFHSLLYKEEILLNRGASDQCLYLLRCALSTGAEKNCPCESNSSCIYQLLKRCNSSMIQYPTGALLAPYAFSFYSLTRIWNSPIPDSILLNGTIKCRRHMAERFILWERGWGDNVVIEYNICSAVLPFSARNVVLNRLCHSDSLTFNNHSYHFIDVCQNSEECISAYRINDGYWNCLGGGDEDRTDLVNISCANVRPYRLRCSEEEPSCLPIVSVGDQYQECTNHHDEFWMGIGRPLSTLVCNKQAKGDCQLIRQYIEKSWKTDTHLNNSITPALVDRIPFFWFCDTFWHMNLKEDEAAGMCQTYWTCKEDQWRCHTGQCIKADWVLDGEWDCPDASDEEAIFFSHSAFSIGNVKLRNESSLRASFELWYRIRPFGDICNLSIEYPCYRIDSLDPLNLTQYRPCISLAQIGDGHVDCIGSLDEKNNRQHCTLSSVLGYSFQCPDENRCVSYRDKHLPPCADSRIQCHGLHKSSNCPYHSGFTCRNGTCVMSGWCNKKLDCSHGEDEYMCILRKPFLGNRDFLYYRVSKRPSLEEKQIVLDLPSVLSSGTLTPLVSTTLPPGQLITNHYRLEDHPSSVPFWCNRGVGVLLFDGSTVCFCPPQYYGDKCQYHSDRLTVLLHLNLSQSVYEESNDPTILLKLVIIFLR
jgi:hypothetical protein